MYCRTPPIVAMIGDEYWASSVHSPLCHIGLPVLLSSASIVPLAPPGVTINLSPSTSGDSAYAHFCISPPKSTMRFARQTSLPSVVRQARSPYWPRTYSLSPSTVGVPRVPVRLGSGSSPPPAWPSFVDQRGLPDFSSSAR